MVALVDKKIQALVDAESNLNIIQKKITVYLYLRSLFPAKAVTQDGSIPFKIYKCFCERIQIMDSFWRISSMFSVNTLIKSLPMDSFVIQSPQPESLSCLLENRMIPYSCTWIALN